MGRQKCQVFVSCSMLKSNNWCINILWRGWINYSRRIINNQHYTCSHRPRHEFLMLAEIMHYFSITIACILQKMFILLTSTYGIFLMPSKLVFVSCHRNYIKKTQSCFPVINFLTTVKWNNDLELTFTADDQWTGNEGFCTKKQKTKQKFDSLNSWTSSRILTIYLPVSYEIWFELGCIKV